MSPTGWSSPGPACGWGQLEQPTRALVEKEAPEVLRVLRDMGAAGWLPGSWRGRGVQGRAGAGASLVG